MELFLATDIMKLKRILDPVGHLPGIEICTVGQIEGGMLVADWTPKQTSDHQSRRTSPSEISLSVVATRYNPKASAVLMRNPSHCEPEIRSTLLLYYYTA